MDEELPELDFGEIQGVIPPGCCDDNPQVINESDIVSNYVILAHLDDKDRCSKDRKFMVNLHRNGTWSFTFSNGEQLTDEQVNQYCSEIAGAQSKLTNERRWILNGRGLGVWDQSRNLAGSDGAVSDDNTQYLPSGGKTYNQSSCSILGQANLQRPQ